MLPVVLVAQGEVPQGGFRNSSIVILLEKNRSAGLVQNLVRPPGVLTHLGGKHCKICDLMFYLSFCINPYKDSHQPQALNYLVVDKGEWRVDERTFSGNLFLPVKKIVKTNEQTSK